MSPGHALDLVMMKLVASTKSKGIFYKPDPEPCSWRTQAELKQDCWPSVVSIEPVLNATRLAPSVLWAYFRLKRRGGDAPANAMQSAIAELASIVTF